MEQFMPEDFGFNTPLDKSILSIHVASNCREAGLCHKYDMILVTLQFGQPNVGVTGQVSPTGDRSVQIILLVMGSIYILTYETIYLHKTDNPLPQPWHNTLHATHRFGNALGVDVCMTCHWLGPVHPLQFVTKLAVLCHNHGRIVLTYRFGNSLRADVGVNGDGPVQLIILVTIVSIGQPLFITYFSHKIKKMTALCHKQGTTLFTHGLAILLGQMLV
jgi:hypothetical protein